MQDGEYYIEYLDGRIDKLHVRVMVDPHNCPLWLEHQEEDRTVYIFFNTIVKMIPVIYDQDELDKVDVPVGSTWRFCAINPVANFLVKVIDIKGDSVMYEIVSWNDKAAPRSVPKNHFLKDHKRVE